MRNPLVEEKKEIFSGNQKTLRRRSTKNRAIVRHGNQTEVYKGPHTSREGDIKEE